MPGKLQAARLRSSRAAGERRRSAAYTDGTKGISGEVMKSWAYVFISTRQPKKVLRLVRQISGVIHADAIFGRPDVIAIVVGEDIASMDVVIDEIAEIPDIAQTNSKVARWIDGIEFPIRDGAK